MLGSRVSDALSTQVRRKRPLVHRGAKRSRLQLAQRLTQGDHPFRDLSRGGTGAQYTRNVGVREVADDAPGRM